MKLAEWLVVNGEWIGTVSATLGILGGLVALITFVRKTRKEAAEREAARQDEWIESRIHRYFNESNQLQVTLKDLSRYLGDKAHRDSDGVSVPPSKTSVEQLRVRVVSMLGKGSLQQTGIDTFQLPLVRPDFLRDTLTRNTKAGPRVVEMLRSYSAGMTVHEIQQRLADGDEGLQIDVVQCSVMLQQLAHWQLVGFNGHNGRWVHAEHIPREVLSSAPSPES